MDILINFETKYIWIAVINFALLQWNKWYQKQVKKIVDGIIMSYCGGMAILNIVI